MLQTIRLTVQSLSLVIFFILFILGKIGIWMLVILAGLVISLGAGRFYCGWLCPIKTCMRAAGKIKKSLLKKQNNAPNWVYSPVIRWSILILFVFLIVYSSVKGIELSLILYLIIIGVVVTFIYSACLWHRYLCPFGTLFTLPSRLSFLTMYVDRENCISCGLCVKNCPGGAINLSEEEERAVIRKHDCLECFRCQDICPVDAVSFSTINKAASG